MDINLMVLNVGNTRLHLGVFVAGELKYNTRIPHDQRDLWPGKIAEAWRLIADADSPAVAAATVNPPIAADLGAAVEKVAGHRVQWVGADLDPPIAVKTQVPSETGVDRILNIAAAHEQMGKACVVVDAGSAVTVDCCDDAGAFLGGAIAPGTSMMLAVLHERTAKLPLVDFAAPVGVIGDSTEQAIRHGVFHGIRGLVKEVAENYAMELGNWPEIIATGGDAHTLFDGWELIHAIAPDLTLYGIALAYVNHHIKHGE